MTRRDGGGPGGVVTVALVEDEALYRDLLRAVLAQQPRLRVVGAFGDGAAALAALPALRPRVALLDIELGLRLRAALPALAAMAVEPAGLDGVVGLGSRRGAAEGLRERLSQDARSAQHGEPLDAAQVTA